MSFGYAGQLLHVDLTKREIRKEALDEGFARRYIGGMGWGTKILYDEVPPEMDALSPGNVLVVATGPLVGTAAPSSDRIDITAKSPLTGIFGSANGGGLFAPALKYAGIDAVIVRGKADRPVYLWIDDDRIELRDANHLWGKDTWTATSTIRQDVGERQPFDVRVLAIGPGGENLVRYAAIIIDMYHTAARSGLGAVMGSKNLKAIAARGTGALRVAYPAGFLDAALWASERLKSDLAYEDLQTNGAMSNIREIYQMGAMPCHNFQSAELPGFLDSKSLEAAVPYIARTASCHCCPTACYHPVEVTDGKYAGLRISSGTFSMPVFEWGAKCAVESMPAIWKCKETCELLGLDQASAAVSVAFAMELYQRGIIDKSMTDGLELTWGNEDAVLELLGRIARRQGFGALLAEGVARAAKALGDAAVPYAMTLKGQEVYIWDPRAGTRAWHLGFLTSNRGGDNVKNSHFVGERIPSDETIRARYRMTRDEFVRWAVGEMDMFDNIKDAIYGSPPTIDGYTFRGKPLLLKWSEDLFSAVNSLGICMIQSTFMHGLGPTHYARLLSTCTGWDISPKELMQAGERIFTLQRAYLTRHGIGRKDDHWPERFYREKLPNGARQGAVLLRDEIDRALTEYYQLRGWDGDDGKPLPGTMQALGLGDAVSQLYA